jgi:polysaccharide biosynthesis protein PslA
MIVTTRNDPKPSIITHRLIDQCVKACDVLCLLLAGLAAGFAHTEMTLVQSLLMSVLAIFPYRIIGGNKRVYRWDRYHSLRWGLVDITFGLVSGSSVLWVFAQVFHPGGGAGWWLFCWISTALVSIAVSRSVAHLIVSQLHQQGVLTRRVAVIGAGEEGVAAVEHLMNERVQNGLYQIVGIFDDRSERCEKQIAGIPVTKSVDRLLEVSRHTHIDAVIVALPIRAQERISFLMRKLISIPAEILLLMDISWLKVKEVRLRNVEGYSFLQVARRPLLGGHAMLKAIEDYVVAVAALSVVWPVMIATAIAIRLEGPGPILFRQKRIGFNHREFDLLKFRSMALDPSDDGSKGTNQNDPRITRVGRFIRKHSIDELPQLFNVLKGEMSVVGPRAHVPKMLVGEQIYPEAVMEYPARHRVKPGITGWAQINGMRGGIHTEAKARRGVELDLEYVDGWSPWLDLQIMARTIFGGLWGSSVF